MSLFRKVFDGAWGWRALRLLAKRSPHFFTYGNNPIARLPDYLEQMLKKMVKESAMDKGDEGVKKKGSVSTKEEVATLSEKDLANLSEKLSSHWKKLAPKLGLASSLIDKIEADHATDEGCVLKFRVSVEV